MSITVMITIALFIIRLLTMLNKATINDIMTPYDNINKIHSVIVIPLSTFSKNYKSPLLHLLYLYLSLHQ